MYTLDSQSQYFLQVVGVSFGSYLTTIYGSPILSGLVEHGKKGLESSILLCPARNMEYMIVACTKKVSKVLFGRMVMGMTAWW